MNLIKDKLEWVRNKLIENPALRDSNERLYYNYLIESGYDMTKNVKEFLKDMENRIIPYSDSISRASRLIQEKNIHLRGKLWNKRKVKSREVKEEILILKSE